MISAVKIASRDKSDIRYGSMTCESLVAYKKKRFLTSLRHFTPLLLSIFCAVSLCMGKVLSPAFAHGGHDHGAAEALQDVNLSPRMTLRSTDFDLVAIKNEKSLIIYLDKSAGNTPISKAKIWVSVGGNRQVAQEIQTGIYLWEMGDIANQSHLDVIFEVSYGNTSDLLAGHLHNMPASNVSHGAMQPSSQTKQVQHSLVKAAPKNGVGEQTFLQSFIQVVSGLNPLRVWKASPVKQEAEQIPLAPVHQGVVRLPSYTASAQEVEATSQTSKAQTSSTQVLQHPLHSLATQPTVATRKHVSHDLEPLKPAIAAPSPIKNAQDVANKLDLSRLKALSLSTLASTAFALIGMFMLLKRQPVPLAGVLFVLSSVSFMAHSAFAQTSMNAPAKAAYEGYTGTLNGETKRTSPLLPFSTDAPKRLSDGSIFVPKSTQRLLDIRTASANVMRTRPTVTLQGTLIADPSHSAVVQSLTGGRIMPLPNGFPQLGQSVNAGDPLLIVMPLVQAAESATLAGREVEINLAMRRNLEQMQAQRSRLSEGGASITDINRTQMELMGLNRQRERVRNALRGETLTAPVDGVIAAMNVRAGQVVQSQDVLFQIFNPSHMWIEVSAYGADIGEGSLKASATTPDGKRMELLFRGRSQALREQAVVMQFEIVDPPDNLNIGQPLSVYAEAGTQQTGVVIPRSALVRAGNGEYVVYDHTEPELFMPRKVNVEALDGERALVKSGLDAGRWIVTHAAEFVNQVR
jgi:multidrug efflux pump subunit AcrA (membrane-fusion protein)